MSRKLVLFLGFLSLVGMLGYFLPNILAKTSLILNAPSVVVLGKNEQQRLSADSLKEPTTGREAKWKGEDQLLKSISRLFFKKMTPSKILLEDVYFTPSELQDLDIYQDRLLSSVRCEQDGWLIVLLPSKPDSADERSSIRETWGSVARGKSWPWVRLDNMDVKLIFVIGVGGGLEESKFDNLFDEIALANEEKESDTHNYTTLDDTRFDTSSNQINSDSEYVINNAVKFQNISESFESTIIRNESWISTLSQIHSEFEIYGDILLASTIDTYSNLTRKILRSLKWTVEHCRKAKYILKVDQDIFVNIPLMWTFLKHYGEKNSVYGHIYPNGHVQREGIWNVSRLVLPIDRYPIYASGNAYILSLDAAAKIVEMGTHFPYVPVEDAFITGILASVTHVDRFSVAGFTRWMDTRPHSCEFVADKIYTGNQVDEYFKRVIWKDIHEKQTLCK